MENSGGEVCNPFQKLRDLSAEFSMDISEEGFAEEMDRRDPLSHFRDKFLIPKAESFLRESRKDLSVQSSDCIYLCGNSLGLQPRTTRKYIEEELQEWENVAVEAHFRHSKNRPWLTTDENVLEHLAHIVGASSTVEVAVMNSLTVNLHLMMLSFYKPSKERYKIMIEGNAFPSDLFAVQSQIELHGFSVSDSLLQLEPRPGEYYLRTEDILSELEQEGERIALLLLPGVQYYSGQLLAIETITAAAHRHGIFVGWDLAHAVGNVSLSLHQWNVDFACWCSYKYLNAGPGSIGGCFLHRMHESRAQTGPRLAGWWGQQLPARFEMNSERSFRAVPGAAGFRLSNPPVFEVAALRASAELFFSATMPALAAKTSLLSSYLLLLLSHHHLLQSPQEPPCGPCPLVLVTPWDPAQRGCQLSLLCRQPLKVNVIADRLLHEDAIVCDVRQPNVLRLAPTPLYNRFRDLWIFVRSLSRILNDYAHSLDPPTTTISECLI